MSALAVPAQAQIPEAHYVGDHDGNRDEFSPDGPRIEFDVSTTGTSVQNLGVLDLPYSPDIKGFSRSIRDHTFEIEVETPPFGLPGPSCRYGASLTLTGTFDDGQGVVGHIRDELIDCTFNVDQTRNLTWSASTDRFRVVR